MSAIILPGSESYTSSFVTTITSAKRAKSRRTARARQRRGGRFRCAEHVDELPDFGSSQRLKHALHWHWLWRVVNVRAHFPCIWNFLKATLNACKGFQRSCSNVQINAELCCRGNSHGCVVNVENSRQRKLKLDITHHEAAAVLARCHAVQNEQVVKGTAKVLRASCCIRTVVRHGKFFTSPELQKVRLPRRQSSRREFLRGRTACPLPRGSRQSCRGCLGAPRSGL